MDTKLLLITIIIIAVLKICNMVYIFKINRTKEKILNNIKKNELISSSVEHRDFKKVAMESLRINSPMRVQNDFLDFIFENIDTKKECIENKIITTNYGDYFNEQ